jgi:outer membrane lipoprotein-sorting protein
LPQRLFGLICSMAAMLVAAFTLHAADNPLAATMARMDKAAATFRGLSANVRKVSHTAVINEDTVDTGTILVRRPKPREQRVRIDFEPPNTKQIAISGRTAQIYYPKTNSVEEYDLGKYKGMVDQFLLLGFGSNSRELESAYSIRLGGPENVAGQKATKIELIPKSADILVYLKRVDLWISDDMGIAVQQKLYEPGGDYLLASYTNVKLNPEISDSALKLNLPKDVHREYPQKQK